MATYTETKHAKQRPVARRSRRQQSYVQSASQARRPPDFLVSLLIPADIRLNGDRPWDIQVHDSRLYKRVMREGSLGFAKAYMDGWWDCQHLDELFTRLVSAEINQKIAGLWRLKLVFRALAYRLINFQSIQRAFMVGERHYDIGNDLYVKMLDPHMMYSCGYWAEAKTLAQAQEAKMDLICRKLKLQPGMKLLDIGCGWGGMAAYAAKHYGVEVMGITISQEQQKLAGEMTRGLPVDIMLEDYRSLSGRYDRIVSVGMFEHVGVKNYQTYFSKVTDLLADDGLFLLHTIGSERSAKAPEPFLHKYIFPNGKIPSRQEINDASFGRLRLEDWHNFGPDYDRTLMAWADSFERAWPELDDGYNERFRRMWRYYLNSCAGFFRSRHGQLWQLVYTQLTSRQEYRSLR